MCVLKVELRRDLEALIAEVERERRAGQGKCTEREGVECDSEPNCSKVHEARNV